MFANVLSLLYREPSPSKSSWHAMALICQCLKALEQVAIDGGSWDTAIMGAGFLQL